MRQNEGRARSVAQPDTRIVTTQKATRTQASAKWGAVAGRRMSAGAGVRSGSGGRSHAECGARALGGIDQAGARTNDEMRQNAPPQHEARSPTGVSQGAGVRGERPRAHERSERKRREERPTDSKRRTGMTELCEPQYNATPVSTFQFSRKVISRARTE